MSFKLSYLVRAGILKQIRMYAFNSLGRKTAITTYIKLSVMWFIVEMKKPQVSKLFYVETVKFA